MRTILLMIWANIKSKKLQSVALGAIFVAVSILFFLSVRLFGSTGDYEDLFAKSKSSQSYIYVNNGDTKDIIVDFLSNHEDIDDVNVLANYDKIMDAKIQQDEVSIPIPDAFFTEYSSNEFDQLKIIEGKLPEELLLDEVIFSYGKSKINNVEIGDKLVVNTEQGLREMTIAAIAVDLTFNFDTITINRFWTSKDTIESFDSNNEGYSIGIAYSDYSKETEQKILDDLNVTLGEKTSETFVLAHSIILDANSFFQVVMGAIFTLIGVILIVVALFIIRSIIFNNILTESKKIATLKSVGFSSKNIMAIYLLEYCFIAFISIIIGIFGSLAVSDVVLKDLTELSNIFGLSNHITIAQVIAVMMILLLIIEFTVYLAAKGVTKVNPAVALNRGEQINESKQVIALGKHKNMPVSLVLALKDIMYNKRMVATLVLFIIATTFTVVTLSSSSHSFGTQKQNVDLWLGYDIDATIESKTPLDLDSHIALINKLDSSEYVEGTVTKYIDTNSYVYDEIQGKYVTAISEVFVSKNLDELDFNILDGRIPENENEIMLARNLLISSEKKLGDYITVLSLGENKEALIVGEYQSLTNQGQSFRVFLDNIPEEFINNSYIQVNFKNEEEEVLIEEIESIFNSNVNLIFEKTNASMVSMIDILGLVTSGVVSIFGVICLVVLLNLNITNVNKERFNYGIYKSIGMSNQSIVNVYLFKNTVINIVGIIIGGFLAVIALPSVMNAIIGSLGINEFPTSINYISIIVAIGIVFGVTFMNAFFIKRSIASINPVELLVE